MDNATKDMIKAEVTQAVSEAHTSGVSLWQCIVDRIENRWEDAGRVVINEFIAGMNYHIVTKSGRVIRAKSEDIVITEVNNLEQGTEDVSEIVLGVTVGMATRERTCLVCLKGLPPGVVGKGRK